MCLSHYRQLVTRLFLFVTTSGPGRRPEDCHTAAEELQSGKTQLRCKTRTIQQVSCWWLLQTDFNVAGGDL